MDSPGSPLSELSSEDFQEDHPHPNNLHSLSDAELDHDASRPSKRQRVIGPGGHGGPAGPTIWDSIPIAAPEEDISSDTDGSVPGSPHVGAAGVAEDEDYGGYGHREQISLCKWGGCNAGEMGNMDLLVQHLHDEHIHARQKKYSCEWGDCTRKGIAHASGYALRAHMRSHTREKPFFCSLPECDRSFTRSDALAKHMRTVHETEALRPSDPVPKHHSSNPQNKSQRVKLTFKGLGGAGSANGDVVAKVEPPKSVKPVVSAPPSPSTAPTIPPPDVDYENNNVVFAPALLGSAREVMKQFPPDIVFDDWELALPAPHLLQALRTQLHFASQDGDELRKELDELDARRKQEWTAKELVAENVWESEEAIGERHASFKMNSISAEEATVLELMKKDVEPCLELEVEGEGLPWWRQRTVARMMDEVRDVKREDVGMGGKVGRADVADTGGEAGGMAV